MSAPLLDLTAAEIVDKRAQVQSAANTANLLFAAGAVLGVAAGAFFVLEF